jgi:Fe-Mn family superoxide dismutase
MSAAAKPAGNARFKLPPLPYAAAALEPAVSAATLTEHHGAHHKKYIDETNRLIAGTAHEGLGIVELIRTTAGKAAEKKLFNNAAQAWNHAFYWRSLTPQSARPDGELEKGLETTFGSLDAFNTALLEAATAHFGSGWAWLIAKGGKLSVVTTHDAATPLTDDGVTPLLTIDVWEHAYYLDRKHDRPAYLKAVVERHLNWTFAAANLWGNAPDLGLQ